MKIHSVEFIAGVPSWDLLPPPVRPEIAVHGRSNVGKSSLLNLLVGRKSIARTSKTPGRTRQLNIFRVEGSRSIDIVDLPGYGYAKVPRPEREAWGRLVERYLRERETLVLMIQLIDSRHEPSELDRAAFELMAYHKIPTVIALTKTDKTRQRDLALNERATADALAEAGLIAPIVRTSALKRVGVKPLWRLIEDAVTAAPQGRRPAVESADSEESESEWDLEDDFDDELDAPGWTKRQDANDG